MLNRTFSILSITDVKHGGGRSDIKTVEDYDLNVNTFHRRRDSISEP